jgi:hypothetical protein
MQSASINALRPLVWLSREAIFTKLALSLQLCKQPLYQIVWQSAQRFNRHYVSDERGFKTGRSFLLCKERLKYGEDPTQLNLSERAQEL